MDQVITFEDYTQRHLYHWPALQVKMSQKEKVERRKVEKLAVQREANRRFLACNQLWEEAPLREEAPTLPWSTKEETSKTEKERPDLQKELERRLPAFSRLREEGVSSERETLYYYDDLEEGRCIHFLNKKWSTVYGNLRTPTNLSWGTLVASYNRRMLQRVVERQEDHLSYAQVLANVPVDGSNVEDRWKEEESWQPLRRKSLRYILEGTSIPGPHLRRLPEGQWKKVGA